MKDLRILDSLITGRVEPHIYAFTTNTIPNYLKVGDTYRPVSKRLAEWKEHFPNLEKKFEDMRARSAARQASEERARQRAWKKRV